MEKNIDIRLLTYKRWNLPPMGSLVEYLDKTGVGNSDIKRYVSFQNYHIVEVAHINSTEMNDALQTVARLQRKTLDSGKNEDMMYTQHMLPVFGRESSFWNEESSVLYITMIQLDEGARFESLELAENAISKYFSNWKEQYVLYYSLEYCDMIMFARDIPSADYQERLWKLIFDASSKVRDTVTVSCFSATYFMKKMKGIREGTDRYNSDFFSFQGRISLSVDISIKNVSGWRSLDNSFRKVKNANIWKVSGRNDIHIDFIDITEDLMFYIIDKLDTACESNAIDIYEIVPLLSLEHEQNETEYNEMKRNGGSLFQIEHYYERYRMAAEAICSNLNIEKEPVSANLIYQTLISSNKTGFVNELVVSLLRSLVEYTRVCEFYAKATESIRNETDPDDYKAAKAQIRQNMEMLLRDYMHALNTLVQCTTHEEGKFVQVPTLNCPAFNVPPKLLAIYSGIANSVANAINDESNRTFSVLIVPDYRADIYVRQIAKEYGKGSLKDIRPCNILVIYLGEQLFYEPKVFISRLCHEIAHYVGGPDRQREYRASSYFRTVAMYVVCVTYPLFKDSKESISLEFADKLAEALGESLEASYKAYEGTYLLENLSNYIVTDMAVSYLMEAPKEREILKERIIRQLKSLDLDILRIVAARQDDLLSSTYISKMLDCVETREAAFGLIAGRIVQRLSERVFALYSLPADDRIPFSFLRLTQASLQAYSEAYSDYRMIELLDQSEEFYKKVAKDYQQPGQCDVQGCMRHNAVIKAEKWKTNRWDVHCDDGKIEPEIDYFIRYTEGEICDYLNKCGRIENAETIKATLRNYIEEMSSTDPDLIFNGMLDQFLDYKKELYEYMSKESQYRGI